MPLHITYRPQSLHELVGNVGIKESLATVLARQDHPRAFLFVGPSGCGKTTLARIVAKELGCAQSGYHELNISDARGIDDARQLLATMHYVPLEGRIRVFCLDECQQATSAFQQAMLKALEDTPSHVVFILCTTDPHKLLKTIRTRCSLFELSPLSGPDLRILIRRVLDAEGVANFPAHAIDEIVAVSEGSPRQALVVLDQVIDITDDEKLIAAIRRTVPSDKTVLDLCALLHAGSVTKWSRLADVIKALGDDEDWEKVRLAVLSWATKVALSGKGAEQAVLMIEAFSQPWFNVGRAGLVLACYRCIV